MQVFLTGRVHYCLRAFVDTALGEIQSIHNADNKVLNLKGDVELCWIQIRSYLGTTFWAKTVARPVTQANMGCIQLDGKQCLLASRINTGKEHGT